MISKKIIENSEMIIDIKQAEISTIYEKLEIINNNFKEMNKYYMKINGIDKIVKEKLLYKEDE